MFTIDLEEYNYGLPQQRIAQFPVNKRDESLLLLFRNNEISKDKFKNIYRYIPPGSLLVFNNTKVIRARILFSKPTGSTIEVLCLEPLIPSDYELSFSSKNPVEWKCIIGNQKKWKAGSQDYNFIYKDRQYCLKAEKTGQGGESVRIRFLLDPPELTFGEVLESTGHIPLPPYIRRNEIAEDYRRYQTVYSSVKGSVAAPTAGLHFTEGLLRKLNENGIAKTELTLHVGAGTFKPVKAATMEGHEMHAEWIEVSIQTIGDLLLLADKPVVAVGTTSLRTLESLYWMGVKTILEPNVKDLQLTQWEVYEEPLVNSRVPAVESLSSLQNWLKVNKQERLFTRSQILIAPGYTFKIAHAVITNFHQPQSTLLLLVAAAIGNDWRMLYEHALQHDFRFLSYGDGSLLFINK